jgi:response regulator RpfG family c-di-GMP phosphodiesterase
MSDKILLVDDDQNLLSACERILHKQFHLETALGAEAALEKIAGQGPYAVVVSDRQMPVMDGITFLSLVKERSPDTVRIMLSGNIDLAHAVRVVNEGNIFRMLLKPCPQDILISCLKDALAQYRLVTSEKELLGKTLNGSIKLLTEILSATENKALGQTERLRKLIDDVARKSQTRDVWAIHLAAMLASIGFVTLPAELVVKSRERQTLSKKEEEMINSIPEISARLISNIPRLEAVSKIIRYQQKHFDGSGLPVDTLKGEDIPFGARLLKIFTDLTQIQSRGLGALDALDEMERRQGWYDPGLMTSVRAYFGGVAKPLARPVETVAKKVKELQVGMVLASDISTTDDNLILPAGHIINPMTLEKLRNFAEIFFIKEPIFVEAPQKP